VPQDLSDEDALTGTWKRDGAHSMTAEQLDEKVRMELKHEIGTKIWRTERLELEVAYNQKQLKEMKQSLLYDAQNLDKEIVEYGVGIAESFHRVRKPRSC
jgi:hypothetical protein